MASFVYLGNNCGTIHSLGSSTERYALKADGLKSRLDDITAITKANRLPSLIVFTANYYQTFVWETLKENGFRAVISFLSAHDNPLETLTFWIKHDKEAPLDHGKMKGTVPHNCSVAFDNNIAGRRFNVVTSKPQDKTFKKVRNAQIWFKVDPKYVVPTTR